MKITMDWIRFEQASIPQNIRIDIIQAIHWVEMECGQILGHEMVTLFTGQELLAQRMINLYLTGSNDGMKDARKAMHEVMKGFSGNAR